MAVVLAILKFIGILLLLILGIVLVLLLMVLLVPVRYVVECRCRNELRLGFRISWLLRLVQIKRSIQEQRINVFLLGINIRKWKSFFQRGRANETQQEEEPQKESRIHLVDDLQEEGKRQEKAHRKSEQEDIKIETDYEEKREDTAEKQAQKSKKSFSFDQVSGIIAFIRDNEYKAGIKKIKRELMALVKYLMPDKLQGKISFGTGDPCTTGWILGVVSMFSVAYTEGLTICPDFEEKYFRANGTMCGKIRAVYFLRLVLRGYLDDDIKKIVIKIMKSTGK